MLSSFKIKTFKKLMLEYVKLILEKVSFDQQLFEKELRKNMQELIKEEVAELKKWCYENFSMRYPQVLNRCFA